MLSKRHNQAIILWILLVNISFIINTSAQQHSNSPLAAGGSQQKLQAYNSSAAPVDDPSNGVDDILKDTILLLDVLDEKLSAVKNKTPNAMMRDNLRALDGANDDYQQQYQRNIKPSKHQLQSGSQLAARSVSEQELASRPDEEASIEEALVRMADGFASGRRSDQDAANELLVAAATNSNEEPQSARPKLINHYDEPTLEFLEASIGPQGDTINQQQQLGIAASGSTREGSKKARQLTTGGLPTLEDNYQQASDSTERHIKFTLDLMQSIFTSQSYTAKTNLIESFLISPLSIQMVLMMMHLGARGQTKREISNCLHLTASPYNTTPSSSSSLSPSSVSQPSVVPPSAPYGSSSNADKSLIMMQQQHLHHLQQLAGATVGNDLAGAVGADTMGSKLRRRHQQQQMLHQQVSSENVKPQSAVGHVSSKSQQQATGANLRHQQQAAPTSSQQQQPSASTSNAAAAPLSALGAGNSHELFSGAMRNLLKDPIVLKSLTSANQIFLQKNLPLSAQYEWAIRHHYAADVKLVDFQHQTYANERNSNNNKPHANSNGADHPSGSMPLNSTVTNVTLLEHHHQQQQQQQKLNARDEHLNGNNNNNNIQQMVNDWIERQTKGKISNFLSSPISTSTLMMAINVLYFKGDWQYKFDPSDTETDAWFTQANGQTIKTPMMVNRLPLAFAHNPAMKTSVIELPYKAQRLGLFLLLPDEVSGIFHTMQMLNSTSFANLISSMRKPLPGADQGASGINVRIPKFSIESSPRLSQILSQQMGLKSLFMPDVADLSGMFNPLQQSQSKRSVIGNSSNAQQLNGDNTNNNQQAPLQVGLDELLHKAVLQVDEQGSVAAASSATIVERVGLFNSNYFEADHPFLLFLMDKQTGLVLFSGVFAGNNNNVNSNNHETQQQQRH